MQSVSNFEFNQGDLLGHGAFALVFRGRRKKVRFIICGEHELLMYEPYLSVA